MSSGSDKSTCCFEESFEVIDSLLSGYSAAPSSLNESIQESENASAETSEGPIDDINLIENYYQKALSLKSEEVIILSRRVQDCNLQIIKLGNQLKESEDEKLLLARKLAVLEEKLLTLRIRDGQMIREILELDAKCVEFHGGSPSQGTDENENDGMKQFVATRLDCYSAFMLCLFSLIFYAFVFFTFLVVFVKFFSY